MRLISVTVPGSTASAVVLSEQVEPMVELAVAVHGIVTSNGMSVTVPTSFALGPLRRSVIRSVIDPWSSPV